MKTTNDDLPTEILIEEDMGPCLDEARKNIDFGTNNRYDRDNEDHISEWAMAIAISSFKPGDIVPMPTFQYRCKMAKIQQTLSELVDEGEIDAFWDGEAVVYRKKR